MKQKTFYWAPLFIRLLFDPSSLLLRAISRATLPATAPTFHPVTTPRHPLRRLRLEGQAPTSAGEIPACRQARRHSCSPMASFE